jgi:hypothetical protein
LSQTGGEPPVKVRYTVTLDDFVAYHLHMTKKSGAARTGYLMVWLGFPLICALVAVWALQPDFVPVAFVLVVVAVFWLFAFPGLHRSAIARNVRSFVKNLGARGVICERTLILSEDRLVSISETFRIEVLWGNMTGVDVVGECTYLFISGIFAVILPRHGFDSDSEYEAVRDFALRKLDGQNPP